MSNSYIGQILGVSTAIGGIYALPETAGVPFLSLLRLLITITFILVIISSLALRLSVWLHKRKIKNYEVEN